MSQPGIEDVDHASTVLDAEESALAAPAFGDAYWWGTPNEPPVTQRELRVVSASPAAKKLFQEYVNYNGGMLRLGDPVSVAHEDIEAARYTSGALVKWSHETLTRPHIPARFSEHATFTSTVESQGYSVVRVLPELIALQVRPATYALNATWSVVAEARNGIRAFFPVYVNADVSYGAGVSSDLDVAIKVVNIKKEGVPKVAVGRTLTNQLHGRVFYARNRDAKIYKPIYTPERDPADIFRRGYTH